MEKYICCVKKDKDGDIESVGVEHRDSAGNFFKKVETKGWVIDGIENRKEKYYTATRNSSGNLVKGQLVEVIRPFGKTPYLRSKGNKESLDNLDNLPQCEPLLSLLEILLRNSGKK